MFFREWTAILRRAETVGAEQAGAVANANADVVVVDGDLLCRRPEQAQKCFKLDYILWAQGIIAEPAQVARPDLSARCRLCREITDTEPLIYRERQNFRAIHESKNRWTQ